MTRPPRPCRTHLLPLVLAAAAAGQDPVVQVFVLAGQSNMEGKATNELLELQADDPATRAEFAHLRHDGKWAVRDDVLVDFLGRRGGLTVGYGSPGRTGVELEFGTLLGDRLDDPVLLVKTAWGGHSLARQFRPPSRGLPSDEFLARELAQATERVRKRNADGKRDDPLPTLDDIRAVYGVSYRNTVHAVKDALEHCGERFPSLKGRRPVLTGFVWFQGWNDQYEGFEAEYAVNLAHFVRDMRRDLDAPDLPFVIGAMGQNGSEPAKGPMLAIQRAQMAVNELAEFRGTVRAIATDALVDRAAEKLYPTWKEHPEEWRKVGSDHKYHYLGSALWYGRIGHAMGEAMLELLRPR